MPKVLRNLKVDEVSLVDKGANPGAKIVLAKRKVEKQAMTLDEALAKMPEDVKAVVMAALADKSKDKPADKPADGGDPMSKKQELPEDVRKQLDAKDAEVSELKKAREDDAKRIAKLERDGKRGEFIAKARSMGVVPGYSETELGEVLLEASEKLEKAAYEKLEKHFKSMAEIAKKGDGIFKELGSAAGETGESAAEKIQAIAKGLREKDPGLSVEKARTMARKQNPDLRKQEEAEKSSAA